MRLILILILVKLVTGLQAGWKENTVAAILVAEAGIDGRVGMECVAEVLLNRAAAKKVSMISLATSNVFSVLRGTTPTKLYVEALRENKAQLQVAIEIAEVVLNRPQELPKRVHGATHFCQTENKAWWARHLTEVAVVKRHTFYR